MKRVIAVAFFLIVLFSAFAIAEESAIQLPIVGGQIAGWNLDANGYSHNGDMKVSYVKKFNKKKVKAGVNYTSVTDYRRAKGKNIELAYGLWATVTVQYVNVSHRFPNLEYAINECTYSTKDGYGSIGSFNENGRKAASIDMIIYFDSGIQMAIGTTPSGTTALIRYMDEDLAQAVFSAGRAEASAKADRERKEAEKQVLAAYVPTEAEVVENGGIIVKSTY